MGHLYRTARTPKPLTHEQGMVLVIALLFLTAFTLLGMAMFETALMQAKMATNFRQKILSLQRAETALTLAELNIDGKKSSYHYDNNDFSYSITLLPESTGEKLLYRTTAIGNDDKAVTTLQAVTVLEFLAHADGSKRIHKYRLYWDEK